MKKLLALLLLISPVAQASTIKDDWKTALSLEHKQCLEQNVPVGICNCITKEAYEAFSDQQLLLISKGDQQATAAAEMIMQLIGADCAQRYQEFQEKNSK